MGTDDVLSHIDATLDHATYGAAHDTSWDAMRWVPGDLEDDRRDLDDFRVDVFGLPVTRTRPGPPSLAECIARYESMTVEEQAIVRAEVRASIEVVSRALTVYFRELGRAFTRAARAITSLNNALAPLLDAPPLPGQPLDHLPPLKAGPRPTPTTPPWVGRMDGRR